jgi:hypothetical protein
VISLFPLINSNIFSNNGGYGIYSYYSCPAGAFFDGNAYYSNTSGQYFNMADTGIVPDAVNPYVYANNVSCTSSPFNNAAGKDWSLNSNGTGGGLIESISFPNTFQGLSGNKTYTDMGALRHQDPGSAS